MNLGIAITLAPRTDPTILTVLHSMDNLDFDINIFAEPGEYDIDTKAKGFHQNEEKLGCFKNWVNTLQKMVELDYDYIRITQDDMVVNKDALEDAIKFIDGRTDIAINCYTSIRQQMYSGILYKRGWNINDRGWHTWGASFLFSKEVALKLLESKFLNSHLLGWEANQQVDNAVSMAIEEVGITQRLYNPSITTHIGGKSTVDHNDFFVNQRCDTPCEPIYAYCIDGATMKDIDKHFDHVINLKSSDQEEIMKHITHTPGYGFILSPDIEYPQDYVIKTIAELKKRKNRAIVSYQGYTITGYDIERKMANHGIRNEKRTNFSYYGALAFYGSLLWDSPVEYKADFSHTLSSLFQSKQLPIYMPVHKYGWLHLNAPDYLYANPNRPIAKELVVMDTWTTYALNG